ncbi:hypothetical protein QBC46DRAFT_399109 [Diplogelasinospora grovesii]|uniref:Protein kinase domain-containing protein n=1 Tax=Diplogelasinospora grovesii TaxID=303347 RepID=A0AAN6MWF1_9PEZI|nr:hypothetical protein QBC46DRAFT_399109 [Diplogelasinospora grovesii]
MSHKGQCLPAVISRVGTPDFPDPSKGVFACVAPRSGDDEVIDLLPPLTNSISGLPPGFRISLPLGRNQNPPPGFYPLPGSGFKPPPSSGRFNLPPGDLMSSSDSASKCVSNDGLVTFKDSDLYRLSDIRFRLRTRLVFVTGLTINGNKHILQLRLKPSLIIRLLSTVISSWAKTRWPKWFLPRNVILKKRKKDREGEFENETRIYAGVILKDRLAKLLRDAFKSLARYSVGYGDLKLDNLHLIRDNGLKVMVVDLKSVEDINPVNSAFFVNFNINYILRCLINNGFLLKQ